MGARSSQATAGWLSASASWKRRAADTDMEVSGPTDEQPVAIPRMQSRVQNRAMTDPEDADKRTGPSRPDLRHRVISNQSERGCLHPLLLQPGARQRGSKEGGFGSAVASSRHSYGAQRVPELCLDRISRGLGR